MWSPLPLAIEPSVSGSTVCPAAWCVRQHGVSSGSARLPSHSSSLDHRLQKGKVIQGELLATSALFKDGSPSLSSRDIPQTAGRWAPKSRQWRWRTEQHQGTREQQRPFDYDAFAPQYWDPFLRYILTLLSSYQSV